MNLDNLLKEFLTGLGLHPTLAGLIEDLLLVLVIVGIAMLFNFISKHFLIRIFKKITQKTAFFWDDLLVKHNVITYLIHIIPAVLIYILIPYFFEEGKALISLIRKLCIVYIIFSLLMALNGLILALYENYNRKHTQERLAIRGFIQVLQVLLFFLGAIIIIGILINRSPTTLLTGLGASAAIFSLVFKDVITGFIAGIQLSLNDMVRPGDWVTLSDQKTDGIVQEISLMTVKIKNFDNSISTVPPTVLLTNTFKNWREMLASNGRLVQKSIFVDKASVRFCDGETLVKYKAAASFLNDYQPSEGTKPTNTSLFRYYMEAYLKQLPEVNPAMGLRVGELEATDRGLPIQLYFFSRDKEDETFERVQSDVYSHAIAMLPVFDLIIK